MTTKVPNSMLVTPGGGGGGSEVPIAYSTEIPLDIAGAGSGMPATTLSVASVFTVGPTPIENGSCNFTLIGDGNPLHVPDFSAFDSGDGYQYSYNLGDQNSYSAVYEDGNAVIYGSLVGDTGGARAVAHTDAIPLNAPGFGKRASATVVVSADRTLSLGASPVQGGSYDVIFQFSGSHTVSIPGTWIQRGSDAMGSVAGDRTRLIAEYSGTDVVYVLIPMTAIDSTAPALVSIIVDSATPAVTDWTFDETLRPGFVPLASDFAVSGHTPTGTVTLVGSVARVPVTVAFTNGETARTGSYTPGLTANKLQDASGNLVGAIVTQAITNNVSAAGAVKVRLNTAIGANVVESGDGTAGWNYNGDGIHAANVYGGGAWACHSSMSLASGVDGYVRGVLKKWTGGSGNAFTVDGETLMRFGFAPAGADPDYPVGYMISVVGLTGGFYAMADQFGSALSNGVSNRVIADSDWVRVRRAATSIIAEVSSNSGGSWTTIHTFSGVTTGALYAWAFVTKHSGGDGVGMQNITSDVMA